MLPILSECDFNAFKRPFFKPISWVPPSGVGTVLQKDFKNPSELIVQLTAHSTELLLSSFSFFPEKHSLPINEEGSISLLR